MTAVFVGIGSNVERERRIGEGLTELRTRYGALRVSPVYESAAVGFRGNPFFNLVVNFDCALPAHALVAELHAIELRCGRRADAPKFAPRPLDLDLLLYGDLVIEEAGLQLPRPDILQYGFALKPLADLAPDRRHPQLGLTYAELWVQFDGEGKVLRLVETVL
ncbi:MAG: 2-amino-4-hydroxy-6-hydroxymethyldihydropteridine diphosphokinase [Nevskiales bacterium]